MIWRTSSTGGLAVSSCLKRSSTVLSGGADQITWRGGIVRMGRVADDVRRLAALALRAVAVGAPEVDPRRRRALRGDVVLTLENSPAPRSTERMLNPLRAFVSRPGSRSQYSGRAMAMMISIPRQNSSARSRRGPSSSSSSKYGLRLGASSISEPTGCARVAARQREPDVERRTRRSTAPRIERADGLLAGKAGLGRKGHECGCHDRWRLRGWWRVDASGNGAPRPLGRWCWSRSAGRRTRSGC